MLNKFFLFIFLLFLAGAACTKSEGPKVPFIVVQVNKKSLNVNEFSKRLADKMRHYDAAAAKLPSNLERAKNEIVASFIIEVLIMEFAEKEKITVSQDELAAEFDRVRKGYTSDLLFKETLAKSGQLTDELRSRLQHMLLKRKVMDSLLQQKESAVTNPVLKSYYDAHIKDFKRPAEFRLSQIYVATYKESEELRKKIRAGQISFEQAAKKYSLSPDSNNGGDIGFLPKGAVPSFDVVLGLPVGQISSTIKSTYGYHLIKITDKRAATSISFDQARPKILKLVLEQKKEESFKLWLEDQIKRSKIERDSLLIDAMKVYTKGNRL